MELIEAPFDARQVQFLNEFQVHVNPGLPGHPFTCHNRSDGAHGREGGDLGLLIATPEGWVCPHCSYVQSSAWDVMAERRELPVTVAEDVRSFLARRVKSEDVAKRIAEYEHLAAMGLKGADVMVRCLRVRMAEIDASERRNRAGG
ncbi:hypothetical protein [Paraburkholderia youngii]|uniref:hypothetical protein n=1 Tax=Paraburkholderia youngii TaxID=2782701 RepID=UPI003D1E8C0E